MSFLSGTYAFHPKQLFNFQLNRWYSLGYLPYDAMVAAGKKVSNFQTWTAEMSMLEKDALERGELAQAAFYTRAAEFYTIPASEREALYERFAELFYRAFAADAIETHQIPYEGSTMHAMRLPGVAGLAKRGTVLLHGGFEFFHRGVLLNDVPLRGPRL